MKLGIINTYFKDPITKKPNYPKMKQMGFTCADYQQLCDTNGSYYHMEEADFRLAMEQQKAEANAAGVAIHQVHGPWPVDDTSAEKREANLEYYKLCVRGCAYLGSKYLIMHPVMPYGWGAEEDADWVDEVNADFIRKLTDYARPFGVTICLENMPFKLHRLSHVPEVVKFVKALNIDNLGICYDTGHGNLYGDDAGDLVRQCGNLLLTLHVHDNCGQSDEHQMPYLGTIHWDSFLQGLKDIGYTGCMSLENVIRGNCPAELIPTMEELLIRVTKLLTA